MRSKSIKIKLSINTYHIQQIIMSVIKMLIKVLLFIKGLLTVSTSPFIYIYMHLMLFLISV